MFSVFTCIISAVNGIREWRV